MSGHVPPDMIRQFELTGIKREVARMIAHYPELRAWLRELLLKPGGDGRRGRKARADDARDDLTTHTCEVCGRGFTPLPQHAAKAKVCGRATCRTELKARYQQRYIARRAKEDR